MKAPVLLAVALAASAHGGTQTRPIAPVEPRPWEIPPLCLWDGKLCIDIQERVRVEVRDENFDFNDKVDSLTDDGWLLQRFRVGLKFKPTDWLVFYAQAQDSREWDSDRPDFPGVFGAEGDDAFDLRQAYIEIGNVKQFPLTLKVGRQVLSYGDERLIGGLEWTNLARTFDAVKFHFEQPKWWLDVFASSVVVPIRGEFNKSDVFNGLESQRDQLFGGLYFSTTLIPFQTTDLYALYLHENTTRTAAPPNEDTNFATLGFRIKGDPRKLAGFEYDVEAATQFGEVRGLDLQSFAAHAGFGYHFDCWGKPRLYAEYNCASGDEDPFDHDIETFQNLFPTNHKFYGYMDVFSWQNMHNAALSFRLTPLKNLTVQLDGHMFWIADTDDFWYRANGTTTVRPLNPGANQYAGSEVDLSFTWKVNRNLSFHGGYSHFFAGEYLDATGRSADADFVYVQAQIDL